MMKTLLAFLKCCKSKQSQNKEEKDIQIVNNKEIKKILSDYNIEDRDFDTFISEKNATENTKQNRNNSISNHNHLNHTCTYKKQHNQYLHFENKPPHHQNNPNCKFHSRKVKEIQENIEISINRTVENNKETDETLIVKPEGLKMTTISNEESDNDLILFDDHLIRSEEKDIIIFSKNGIMNFVDKIKNLPDYSELYNKNNLLVMCRNSGSILNKQNYIMKSTFKVSKKKFKEGMNIEFMKDFIYNPERRIKWDDSLKVLKKLEGNSEAYVVRSWMKSPIILVAEREVIDKRIEFIKDGIYYNFSSSVNDNYLPEEKGVVRCKTYFNVSTISEDDENFIFFTLSQTDVKMNVNQSILNITIPTKLISWYKLFNEAANKYFEKEKKVGEMSSAEKSDIVLIIKENSVL